MEEKFRIKKQTQGGKSLYHPTWGETMHPGLGALREARHLYLEGSGLKSLWEFSSRVVVFDVGLGAGSNALVALRAWVEWEKKNPKGHKLVVVSFEKDLSSAEYACEKGEALGYLPEDKKRLGELLKKGECEEESFSWFLRVGDCKETLEQEKERANRIFFDPFSPRVNAEMWSISLLEKLYLLRHQKQTMLGVTYSISPGVRANLLAAGFFVGAFGGKKNPLRGTFFSTPPQRPGLPLGLAWRKNWQQKGCPFAGPLLSSQIHKKMVKYVLEHPQWDEAYILERKKAAPKRKKTF